MNKTAIKNYAIWARVQLIEAAKQKAYEYEITDGEGNKRNVDSVGGRLLTKTEKDQREQLIDQINQKGYEQVMEEAAYTWFNRFIALRFMEVNGYLPSKVRVFTDENNAFKPEILKEAMTVELDGIDRSKIAELLDKQDNEELYKYLIITQCNALNGGLPGMFEKISNWTELLFPANLLRPDSIVGSMVSDILEEDWTDAVQIIGWLYQYYNTELKDDTFAKLKKNVKISKERIPAATQLFTPDWIVRYMVENSLGRLWVEGHPDEELKGNWKYYLEEAEQEPEVEEQLKKIRSEYSKIKPEEIKVIDPCMGSGHILVYAFDVLMQIYTSAGWSERDAAKSIIENNLYGLDIDDRAGQLAYFAVMMKARKYSRRILNGEVQPNVLSIQDSSFMTDELIDYVAGKDSEMRADLQLLRLTFKDAKEYGSILEVKPLNYIALYERIDIISKSFAEDIFQSQYQEIAKDKLLNLIRQSEIMSTKYDVVITNPPYMGASGMSAKLGEFVKSHYPDSKSDLFAVFMERGNSWVIENGYNCMVTMQSWMFLSSFEKMRSNILNSLRITTLMHMENMVMGIAFGTAVSVFNNSYVKGYRGTYNQIKLQNIENGEPKQFPVAENRFACISTDQFSKIPGSPVAYWLSNQYTNIFDKAIPLEKKAVPKQGMATADNNRFLRLWHEISLEQFFADCRSHEESLKSNRKWYPYNKGGVYRKWYGNNDYVINWKGDGKELKVFEKAVIRNPQTYFKKCISWSKISSGSIAFRYKTYGHIYDVAGTSIFSYDDNELIYILGVLNSKVILSILAAISPTLNYEVGQIATLPIINPIGEQEVIDIVYLNIEISKADWDSFETSWDFKKHPLV